MSGAATANPPSTSSAPSISGKPAGPSLKKQWDLKDPPPLGSGTNEKAKKFVEDFKSAMVNVKDCLQSTKINAEKPKHDAMVGKRDQIYADFPAKLAEINKVEAKADAVSKPFLARAQALSSEAYTLRLATDKSLRAWQGKETDYNRAVGQIEELEKWDEKDQIKTFRKSSDEIRTATNENKFDESVKKFDELQVKLKPEWGEYEKVKPGLAKIDLAKLKKPPLDLTDLRRDLDSTSKEVAAGIEAEKTIEATEKSEGVSRDKPEEAGGQKITLNDAEKKELANLVKWLEQKRSNMATPLGQMNEALGRVAKILDKLKYMDPDPKFFDAEFWRDLDARHNTLKATLASHAASLIHLVLFIKDASDPKEFSKAIVHFIGDDAAHRLEKVAEPQPKDLSVEVAALGQAVDKLNSEKFKDAKGEIEALQGQISKDAKKFGEQQQAYKNEFKGFAASIKNLASKAKKIPPKFEKMLMAITDARMKSKTAREVLPAATLFDPKWKEHSERFDKLGEPIFHGPDVGKSGNYMRDMIVYQIGGDQYAFRESRASIQKMKEQLDLVKKLHESGTKLDELFKKWTTALTGSSPV
jgi:hypothetical protein